MLSSHNYHHLQENPISQFPTSEFMPPCLPDYLHLASPSKAQFLGQSLHEVTLEFPTVP